MDSCWLLRDGESVFFNNMAPGESKTLQWMSMWVTPIGLHESYFWKKKAKRGGRWRVDLGRVRMESGKIIWSKFIIWKSLNINKTVICFLKKIFLLFSSFNPWPLSTFLDSTRSPISTHKSKYWKLGSAYEREDAVFVFWAWVVSLYGFLQFQSFHLQNSLFHFIFSFKK